MGNGEPVLSPALALHATRALPIVLHAEIVARYALRWRAVVVCRRATILRDLWRRPPHPQYLRRRGAEISVIARAMDFYFTDYPAHEDTWLVLHLAHRMADQAYLASTQLGWEWRTGEAAWQVLRRLDEDLVPAGKDPEGRYMALCKHRESLVHLVHIAPRGVLEYAAATIVEYYEECVGYTLGLSRCD